MYLPHRHRVALGGCLSVCLALVSSAFAQTTVRPITSGAFTDKSGAAHAWSIGPARTLVWDGGAFIPSGVIFESIYLREIPAEEHWQADKTLLDTLRNQGVKDIILRTSAPLTLCPKEAWRKLIDYLDENGFTYGIEINDGPTAPRKFFIIQPGLYRESGLNPPTKRTYKITGVTSCVYCLVDSRSGGLIDLGYAKASGDGQVEVDLKEQVATPLKDNILILYPEKDYGADRRGYPDFWRGFGEYRDRLMKFFEGQSFGPGLRFFLDPLGPGLDISGEFAAAVPDSADFRAEFEAWLAGRYASPSAASTAWGISNLNADSFQQLARLLPLWSEGRGITFAYDRASDARYSADGESSKMWQDFQDFRDSSIQSYMNTIASLLRKYVADVPVIYRSSSTSRVFINGATGGFDGLAASGMEQADAAYSLCDASAKTMWLLSVDSATESLSALQSLGVKAFYPFIASARAGADYSQQFSILRKLSSEIALAGAGFTEYSPTVLYYPIQPPMGGYTAQLPNAAWWLPTLRRGTTVHLGEGVLGYALESDLYIWSNGAPTRLTFRIPTQRAESPTLVYPTDPQRVKSLLETRKGLMTLSVSETPVVLRGVRLLDAVPLEAAKAEIERLAAFANYAEGAGVEVVGYKHAVTSARKILAGGRAATALDMAQVTLQRLSAVFNPYLWFEGESFTAHSFDGAKAIRGASAGLCLAIDNPADPPMSPYSAAMAFDVPRDGKFDIWLAGSTPGRDKASPASFSIDGADWSQIAVATSEPYAPGLYWQNLGTISLAGGRHTFALRLNAKGEDGYRFLFDAVLFASAPFTPKGAAKPLPPSHYSATGK